MILLDLSNLTMCSGLLNTVINTNLIRIPASAANSIIINKVKLEPAKKHVKIKTDPGFKSKRTTPITPDEKISKAIIKPIDRHTVVDQSSKFFLPLEGELDDTPTRKISGSKTSDIHSGKKPKMDLPNSLGSTTSSATPSTINTKSNDALPVTSTPEKKRKPSKSNTMKPPPAFKPVPESLVASANDLDDLGELFKNIDDAVLKSQYLKVGGSGFDEWICHGVKLVDKQYELVRKIVIARTKLNVKFKIIFGKVNEHGKKLESKDEEIKEKLAKLQKLGEEIKSFINC
jgi:hypothetical protein